MLKNARVDGIESKKKDPNMHNIKLIDGKKTISNNIKHNQDNDQQFIYLSQYNDRLDTTFKNVIINNDLNVDSIKPNLTSNILFDSSITVSGNLITEQINSPSLGDLRINADNDLFLNANQLCFTMPFPYLKFCPNETGTTTTIQYARNLGYNINYTVPDVGNIASFIMSEGAQMIGGNKIFTGNLTLGSGENQISFISEGWEVLLTTTSFSRDVIYTIPDVNATADFIMSEGAQTINGTKTFGGNTIFTNSSNVMNSLKLNPTSNQLILGDTSTITINANIPGANRTYTLPDVGTNANFIMSEGAQTINGAKTFGSTTIFNSTSTFAGNTIFTNSSNVMNSLKLNPTSNQLILGDTSTMTINANIPGSNRIYTLPDVGTNANFIMSEGAQTINGTKTFTGLKRFLDVSIYNRTLNTITNTPQIVGYIIIPTGLQIKKFDFMIYTTTSTGYGFSYFRLKNPNGTTIMENIIFPDGTFNFTLYTLSTTNILNANNGTYAYIEAATDGNVTLNSINIYDAKLEAEGA